MRQISLRVLCVLMMTVSIVSLHAQTVWDGTASAQWTGSGTEADPYLISNAKQLAGLAKRVNGGLNYNGKYFKLTTDILLNDTTNWHNWGNQAPTNSWTPIGDYNATTPTSFQGTFDGDGHTIAGLYIKNYDNGQTSKDNKFIGLFGQQTSGIRKTHIVASYIETNIGYIGLLGGKLNSVDNCSAKGKVIAYDQAFHIGGLAGRVSELTNSSADVFITAICSELSSCYVGGLAGYASYYTHCLSTNAMQLDLSGSSQYVSSQYIGGLIGYVGDESSKTSEGYSNTKITINTTALNNSTTTHVGGLCGVSLATTYGYAEGDISLSGNISTAVIGGLIGISDGYRTSHIKKSYAINNISVHANVSEDIYIGGIVGQGEVTDTFYAHGKITTDIEGGTTHIGGLVGEIKEDNIINSYYNVETSGIADNDNLWAKTTQELKTKLTYNDWEFENVWGRANSINNGYPYLRWSQTEQVDAFDPAITFEGAGTEADPYKISTADEWRGFVKSLNGNTFVHKYITLTNDIFLNDTTGWRDWEFNAPVNNDAPAGTDNNSFRGHFDGAGHTIYGLYIKSNKVTHAGLFGVARPGATFEQVRLSASHIEINAPNGGSYIGGLVGCISNTHTEYALSSDVIDVNECAVNAFVYGNSFSVYAGGLIGYIGASTNITNTYVHGIVNASASSSSAVGANIGGLVGYYTEDITYPISDCYAAALVDGNIGYGRGRKHGLIGNYSNATKIDLKRCYYDQEVSLQTGENYGALPKLTAEMKDADTFELWDFTNTWGRRNDTNNGYPYLRCFEGKDLPNDEVIPEPIVISFLKPADWDKVYLYSWKEDAAGNVTQYTGAWPGTEMTLRDAKWYTCQFISLKEVNFIFNNGSGTQSADLYTTESVCYIWENENAKQVDCDTNETNMITSIHMRVDHIALYPNDSYYLNVDILPTHVDNSMLVWSTDNEDVATVDAVGFVTAHSAGKATITAASPDNTVTATCLLTVVDTTTAGEVIVESNDNSALFTWASVAEAYKYTFAIYADDLYTQLICNVTCNAWGQLMDITFPSKKPAAEQPTLGTLLQFTIGGLTAGTAYNFTLNGYNEEDGIVLNKEGQFVTTGNNSTTQVETLSHSVSDEVCKLLENGTLYILRGGEKYTVDGRRIM